MKNIFRDYTAQDQQIVDNDHNQSAKETKNGPGEYNRISHCFVGLGLVGVMISYGSE